VEVANVAVVTDVVDVEEVVVAAVVEDQRKEVVHMHKRRITHNIINCISIVFIHIILQSLRKQTCYIRFLFSSKRM
jgi:hypothetical protein